eukprot:14672774-Alexandrium_andersonii.AAC.1
MDSRALPAAYARRVALARPSPLARATAALAARAVALPGSEGSQGLRGADGPPGRRRTALSLVGALGAR